MAGKAEWLASGMPRDGTHAHSPSIGELVRHDVSLRHLGDRIGAVVPRVQAAGWDQCVVVTTPEGRLMGVVERADVERR